jgi:hypothetical protein
MTRASRFLQAADFTLTRAANINERSMSRLAQQRDGLIFQDGAHVL